MAQLRFPADTADEIEKLWWPVIGSSFPYYGTFWETFIGLRDRTKPFRPYGLVIPPQLPVADATSIQKAYTEVAEAHYSEFCELAGAHYQLEEADNSYAIAGPERLFHFLEAFNGFYDHLGTARNMGFRLWDEVRAIARITAPRASLAKSPGKMAARKKGGSKIRTAIEAELARRSMKTALADLKVIEDQAIPTRDHHIHDYGAYFLPAGGRLRYILPPEEVRDYKGRTGWDVTDEETVFRMRRHLDTIERYLNESERALAHEYSTALASAGINVDY